MKSNIYFYLVSIMSVLCLNFQVMASDPVAYYPFNGNANDKSGNGNNGTVNGATLTIDRFGNENSACSFDGVDDYIELPLLEELNNKSSSTITFWIKTDFDFTSDYSVIFGHWSTTSGAGAGAIGLEIFLSKKNYIPSCAINSVLTAAKNAWTSNDLISRNIWQHVVVAYDGTQSDVVKRLSIYVNGIFKEYFGNIDTPSKIGNLSDRTIIGAQIYNTLLHFYKGDIDDIRIYDIALSESEIENLYNEEKPNSLIAYYPFNGNANDESVNSNNGTVNGATLTTDRFGNENSAYEFDGEDDYISLPSDFDIEEKSITLWFNAYEIPVWDYENYPTTSWKSIFTCDHLELEYGSFKMVVSNIDGVDKLLAHKGGIGDLKSEMVQCYFNYFRNSNKNIFEWYIN